MLPGLQTKLLRDNCCLLHARGEKLLVSAAPKAEQLELHPLFLSLTVDFIHYSGETLKALPLFRTDRVKKHSWSFTVPSNCAGLQPLNLV